MIKNLLFDLDNTLYPASSKMDKGITNRMIQFCAQFFGISMAEATQRRKEALKKYVSTLEWLKAGGLTSEGIEAYFSAVHPKDEINELEENPKLRPLLESIHQKKAILTNSPKEHAEHVLDFFGIRDLFLPQISDIRANGFLGKPFDIAYKNALKIVGGTVEDTIFLDDYPPYVEGFAKIGGKAVLVGRNEWDSRRATLFSGKIFRIDSIFDFPDFLRKNVQTC